MSSTTTRLAPLFAVWLAALGGSPALAAGFPEKPLTLVVPFPPGGATDTMARIISKGMAQRLAQTVIVDNKAGAGTTIGAGAVAQAPADGYTLLISSNTTFTVNPALKAKLPYDAQKSFESIGLIGTSPLVLLANPSLPAHGVKELVALAKAQPGKLAYASFGNGTTAHLAGEMFKLVAGVDILHVPYKGSSPAMTDLIGGQVQLSFDTNVAALPMLRAGHVKALAVTSARRSPSLPQVPTIAEAGYPGFEMLPWITIVAPRGLPPAVQKTLGKALADTLADAAIRADLEKAGVDVSYEPGSFYDARVAKELPLLRAYVHKANIPLE
ncbi:MULTISPECIES: tripartite tricarboxylate transporter substrate binding protein [unclassified Rhizobacter]|uniref:Bug family tripartite tricarboxylate transporter substrate binding protein n=1 Tax=unclassified Rhizobacter TaxID=2640088 RepID=UPI0007000E8E|nr:MULTISPECIES: tripartite tricarboxylate transporter substrate binding protein [unclassified Rhizobacter]KQU75597.1 ABC transporter substrate-binding protein [Rhizobacter sp. Root29]KQW06822.1 ABC transporter substrate-binding protein [Rhizobacter sp. Root1238]KRB19056.1 ABC transporter substrate-binding protein [Rhizobacter sp. Root16D2]